MEYPGTVPCFAFANADDKSKSAMKTFSPSAKGGVMYLSASGEPS